MLLFPHKVSNPTPSCQYAISDQQQPWSKQEKIAMLTATGQVNHVADLHISPGNLLLYLLMMGLVEVGQQGQSLQSCLRTKRNAEAK